MIQHTSKIIVFSILLLATAFSNRAHAAQREILSIGWEDPHLTTHSLIDSAHLVTYKLTDSTDLKKPCSLLEYPTPLHPTNVITNLKESQYPEKSMTSLQPFPFDNSTYQEFPLIYLFPPPSEYLDGMLGGTCSKHET